MAEVCPAARTIPGHGGVPIHVWEYPGDGPPLLLLHCTGALARVWDPVVEVLGARFHVYAPDARGHGDSGSPRSFDDFAWVNGGRDLIAVIDGLGLDTPVQAAGHSMGAAVIAYAMVQRPGLITRPVWIDAIIGPGEAFAGENRLAAGARRRRNRFDSLDDARARLVAKPPKNRWDARAVDAYLAYAFRRTDEGYFELKCPGDREAWFYEHGGACDVFERLGELEEDILLVAGEDSNVRPLVELQHARLRRSTLHVVAGVTHFIPQEAPEAVAEVLIKWFSGGGAFS